MKKDGGRRKETSAFLGLKTFSIVVMKRKEEEEEKEEEEKCLKYL